MALVMENKNGEGQILRFTQRNDDAMWVEFVNPVLVQEDDEEEIVNYVTARWIITRAEWESINNIIRGA